MCIAVGPSDGATVHLYGPTWFDRIVPILSDADIARAAHMDPDVLADPATFPDPARLAPCGGMTGNVQYVFEATPLRDLPRYFPAMQRVAELELDEVGTVVVFRGPSEDAIQRVGGPVAYPNAAPHDVCVIFSQPNPLGPAVLIGDLDTSGFHVRLEPVSDPTPPPTPVPATTLEPAPGWVGDIAGQLECDGPVANIGDEYPDGGIRPEGLGDTPETALAAFLGPGNPYASLPTAGFTRLHEGERWASFGHLVEGRAKAIVVLNNPIEAGSGWVVAGLRACDASEFDPAVPLTFPVTIWTDTSGKRVSTETIRSNPGPGHCGWDSAIWLTVDGDLYFRDPRGVMGDWTTTKFTADTQLPARAVDSGYRSDGVSLWLDPGRDAYLVSADRVERWPRSKDPLIGCM
jgi:hypothetical protein